MTTTPAFARWSLSRNCDYRAETSDPFDPVVVERELRPLQEASLATAEGRIVDGLAIETSDWKGLRADDATLAAEEMRGFFFDEVLDYYGGQDSAGAICGGCPANVCEDRGDRWAGCFGLAMPSCEKSPAELDTVVEASGAAEHLDPIFPHTKPRWYGWWIDGEWNREQIEAFQAALDREAPEGSSLAKTIVGGDRLREALDRSLRHGLGFRVASFPPGRIAGRDWIVEAHCPRCKAPAEPSARFCRVCRRPGGMFPVRVRKARGERPFSPLVKLVSRERVEAVARAVVDRRDVD